MTTKQREVPVIGKPEMAFGYQDTKVYDALIVEAKEAGFRRGDKYKPELAGYVKMANDLFYSGTLPTTWKKGIDHEYMQSKIDWIYALAKSWYPKHEDKEAVLAMLLYELADA